MESISFTCTHCERPLNVPARCAGTAVQCHRCLEWSEVPAAADDGCYALAGESTPAEGDAVPKGRAAADIWRAFGYEGLSASSRDRLGEARALVGEGEWGRAASLLGRLFRASAGGGMTRENAVFRVPLSHCLAGQAVAGLEALRDDPKPDLSRPMRRILEYAAEKQKWGGVFDIHECGLCRGRLKGIAGRPSVRTTVGTAYLCCAKPTKNDQRLVCAVNLAWQRLSLAAVLDDRNDDARRAMKKLPAWQEPLRVEKPPVGRGKTWVRWDEEADDLLRELIEKVIEDALEDAVEGLLDGFD